MEQEITGFISKLLCDHDCVIVPGFGGFVASYQPARMNPLLHSFHPPTKKILFNRGLKTNDGLLASYISMEKKISFEEALEQILDVADQWNDLLESGETLKLDQIGSLYADEEGNVQFVQEQGVNYLNDAYGLTTFVRKPISRILPEKEAQPETSANTQPIYTGPIPAIRQVVYWSAGIAAATLLIGLIVIRVLSVDNLLMSRTGLAGYLLNYGTELSNSSYSLPMPPNNGTPAEPAGDQNQNQAEVSISINQEEAPTDSSGYTEQSSEPAINIPTSESTAIQPVKPPFHKGQRLYHIIAGSFEKPELATHMIRFYTDEGFTPVLLDRAENGYYRMSIAAYSDRQHAFSELERLRSRYNPGIWLLRY